MRLWTVHPRHLDAKGLVAAWREGLLAQKVLQGATRGYRSHPQLDRFRATADPAAAIGQYLRGLHVEAGRRGYRFDAAKIAAGPFRGRISCTRGQLRYEWAHLKRKIRARDAAKYREVRSTARPRAHPLFRLREGPVERWEVKKSPFSL